MPPDEPTRFGSAPVGEEPDAMTGPRVVDVVISLDALHSCCDSIQAAGTAASLMTAVAERLHLQDDVIRQLRSPEPARALLRVGRGEISRLSRYLAVVRPEPLTTRPMAGAVRHHRSA